VHNHAEKIKYDSHEQLENYKQKYGEYKNKLKKANISIQTLTTRVAKYELAMAAEREIVRGGMDFNSNRIAAGGPRHHQMRSSEGALSPNEFNMADYNNEFENQELNEEIKKLLMENQI